ncbi:MAG: hypothetical protein V1667_02295 [bacterium]
MNEDKSISITDAKTKKTKTRKAGKTGVKKSPFGLSGNLNIAPAMPESGFKIKQSPLKKRRGFFKGVYSKISFVFVLLTLILAVSAVYFGFSKMTLVIVPAQEKISGSFAFEVIGKTSESVPAPDQIYGLVNQIPVEQLMEFSSSGKEILGEEVTGKVIIFNNYVKNQPLVATTRLLSSDGKLFRLKNTINIPAGGQAEAEIYADAPKPEMAVGSGKFTIPGLWAGIQDKIYAESNEQMKYSQKVRHIIQQSDIDEAVSRMKNNIIDKARKQAENLYSDYNQAILEVDNNSITQEVNGKVGEEKEEFSVKMKTMVSAVIFKDDEIYEKIKSKIEIELADDKEISKLDKRDISYVLESSSLTQGSAVVAADYKANVILKDSAKSIKKNNLTGLSFEELKVYLNSIPEVAGYQINFFPSFIKKAPNLTDRIEVEIKK